MQTLLANIRFCIYILFFLASTSIIAQTCNCSYTLEEEDLDSTTLNNIWGTNLNIEPGDTICIPAGNYTAIRFYDLVGTAENPIIIINCGGLVTFDAPSYSAISLQRSSNVRLTGTGSSNYEYGIKVAGTNSYSSGIYMENFSTDIEIDHVEVENTGFAGIMGKTDPYCNNSNSWRRNGFTMKNINLHHNYIHDTGGEGIYLGFTGGYKVTSTRSCNGDLIFGHWLEDITIAYNLIERTDLDGIQVNLARANCFIHDNVVQDYALAGQSFQDFAMSIGGGVYEVYNNRMYNSTDNDGKGIQLISVDSGTKLYNNIIVTPKFHGIFIHQRHEFETSNEGFKVFNNTIIEPENSGIHYNTTITVSDDATKIGTTQDTTPSYFVNNFILNPGNDFTMTNTWKGDSESYIDFNNKSTRDGMLPYTFTNLTVRDTTSLYLLDDDSVDAYSVTSLNSILVDLGTDVSVFGLYDDINGTARLQGSGYDIGAYELAYSGSKFPTMPTAESTVKLKVYPNPAQNSFAISGNSVRGSEVYIYTSAGQLLYNGKDYDGEHIDISNFRKGNYFVNVISTEGVQTLQLVKL
ncbi:hypothetical protein NBRC110019_03720 [Neptunitalea chrysea]|uniref:Secretion system C-terminal sorting domain-containing protein n=1 Tax=Neptunitalea chrysea TaxID=1647581 RepID=A0A9W6B2S5_9FLAO|nr:T9SS type A sorting domain-containing protein [Neptunitalea chrysea]GLB51333.1 hypothetical protein NBRC110019_03720 [Neptunitalea chrysea]